MKALNQLKTFQRILGDYPAETPLSKFLPGFYRQNKQMGSTDRKVASRLIYNYFRIGKKLKLIKTAYPAFKLTDVFPWSAELSAGVDKDTFLKSFFVQPDLFIRVRKDYEP